jgi:hypothetical protein
MVIDRPATAQPAVALGQARAAAVGSGPPIRTLVHPLQKGDRLGHSARRCEADIGIGIGNRCGAGLRGAGCLLQQAAVAHMISSVRRIG